MPPQAAQLVEELERANPGAAVLACHASLAIRLDASLLRSLRLGLSPGLDTSAEADLWFSDLAESRDSESLVLWPEVADALRGRLAAARGPDGSRLLDRAYDITRRSHAAWPASLLLEEALIYRGLCNGPDTEDDIAQLLRPAMVALASGEQRGLEIARWAVRALPRMPDAVRSSGSGRALLLAAATLLGAGTQAAQALAGQPLPAESLWLLAEASRWPRVRLGYQVRGQTLLLHAAAPDSDNAPSIELPQTQPLMAELRVTSDEDPPPRLVIVAPGSVIGLPPRWDAIELHTLGGDAFRIERHTAAPEPLAEEDAIDLFISFSHRDNVPEDERQQGWVTLLATTLEAMLAVRLGRKPNIWTDLELHPNTEWQQAIEAAVSRSRLLLCVMSPAYLQSEWRRQELQIFLSRNPEANGGPPRITLAHRQPVPRESVPTEMANRLGFDFFRHGSGDEVYQNLSEADFLRQASALASALAESLVALEGTPNPTGPAVYLADAPRQLAAYWTTLRSELRQRGLQVLPEAPLVTDRGRETLEDTVRQHLARSIMSVHLVGQEPESHDAQTPSLAELQNRLASELSRERPFPRFVWVEPGARSSAAGSDTFVERLLRSDDAQHGADVMWGSFESFRSVVMDQLRKAPADGPPAGPTAQSALNVHLISHARDAGALASLADRLAGEGVVVTLPLADRSASFGERQRHAETCLLACDAAVLLYGAGDESWRRTFELQVRKATLQRPGGPPPTLIVLLGPDTPDKALLWASAERHVIDAREGLDHGLRPLLQALGLTRDAA